MNKRNKIKLKKTFSEWINPRLERVIMHNGKGKATIYLLDKRKELNKKGKRDTFTLNGHDYVYDSEKTVMINKIPYLEYMEGCSLPFTITHGNNTDNPVPEFADSGKLHTVLDMHFLESILSTPSEKIYMLIIIGSLIGGILVGHFLG